MDRAAALVIVRYTFFSMKKSRPKQEYLPLLEHLRTPAAPDHASVPRTVEGLRMLYRMIVKLDSPNIRPVTVLAKANSFGVIDMGAEQELHGNVARFKGASWTASHEKDFPVWVRAMREYFLDINALFGFDLRDHGESKPTIHSWVEAAQMYYTDHPEGRIGYWAPNNPHAKEVEQRWVEKHLGLSLQTPPSPIRSGGSSLQRTPRANVLRLAQ